MFVLVFCDLTASALFGNLPVSSEPHVRPNVQPISSPRNYIADIVRKGHPMAELAH